MGFFRAKKSAAVEPVADGPSATEAKPAKGKAAKKKGSKGKAPAQIKALAGVPAGETWAEALDDTTGYPYYTSSVNGEIVWELPAGAVVAGSGQDGHGGGGGGAGVEAYDPETGAGFFSEAGEVHKRVQLAAFEENMPSPVSSLVGDTGKAVVFPGIFPVSPLVRVSVVENLDPPRHRVLISLGDPEDEASEDWLPSLYFFAFACPMPLTLPYTVEFRRDPGCHRLRQAKNPQSRDITVWSQDDVVRGFFAYPEPVAGTSTFCLDWSSGPDRYKVSDNPAARTWAGCAACGSRPTPRRSTTSSSRGTRSWRTACTGATSVPTTPVGPASSPSSPLTARASRGPRSTTSSTATSLTSRRASRRSPPH